MEEGAQVRALEALAGSWWSARARSLRIHNSRLGDAGAAALLSRPWPRLARLSLERNGFEGLAWLRGEALPALEALDLSHNGNLRAIAEGLEGARLPRLASVRLHGFVLAQEIGALIERMGSPSLPRFERLELPDDAQVPAALKERWARAQERLPGRFTPQGPLLEAGALGALLGRGAMDSVRALSLPLLGAASLEALLEALSAPGALPRLESLEVTGCSPRGLSQILSAPWRGQLQALLLPGEMRSLGTRTPARWAPPRGWGRCGSCRCTSRGWGRRGSRRCWAAWGCRSWGCWTCGGTRWAWRGCAGWRRTRARASCGAWPWTCSSTGRAPRRRWRATGPRGAASAAAGGITWAARCATCRRWGWRR
jgi:hypothetical protein